MLMSATRGRRRKADVNPSLRFWTVRGPRGRLLMSRQDFHARVVEPLRGDGSRCRPILARWLAVAQGQLKTLIRDKRKVIVLDRHIADVRHHPLTHPVLLYIKVRPDLHLRVQLSERLLSSNPRALLAPLGLKRNSPFSSQTRQLEARGPCRECTSVTSQRS